MPRSTLTLALVIGLGLLFTGGGSALAISGFADGGVTAVAAQYASPSTDADDAPTLAPQGDQGDRDDDGGAVQGAGGEDDVAGAPTATEAVQVAAAGGDDSLPLTGWAAIPVLVLGLALLAAGAILRRRTRSS
jgi:hypothetical protein